MSPQQCQESSPDRVTLYSLMMKPIQRFPQFILLLQVGLPWVSWPLVQSPRLPRQALGPFSPLVAMSGWGLQRLSHWPQPVLSCSAV